MMLVSHDDLLLSMEEYGNCVCLGVGKIPDLPREEAAASGGAHTAIRRA